MKTHQKAYAIIFALAAFVSAYAEPKVFFGNLHSHTSYSDGTGTPEQAYRYARDVGRLDFMAITEHNHAAAESGAGDRRDGLLIATDHSLYNGPQKSSLISAAGRFNKDGSFVAIYGQEFSTISSSNHLNVFDVKDVIEVPNGQIKQLLAWLKAHPDSSGQTPLVQFNHPKSNEDPKEYGQDDFANKSEWIREVDGVCELIEVLNGPGTVPGNNHTPELFEKQYRKYLNLGFHIGPTGDQDNHYATWGTETEARTGVVCDQLTKASLIDALRKRHVYATQDKNLRIIAKVNGHLMGDIIPPPAVGNNLDIEVTISDDDEPDSSYTIEVFADKIGGAQPAEVGRTRVDADGEKTVNIKTISSDGFDYLYLKIIQKDEDERNDTAWTAPVWFSS